MVGVACSLRSLQRTVHAALFLYAQRIAAGTVKLIPEFFVTSSTKKHQPLKSNLLNVLKASCSLLALTSKGLLTASKVIKNIKKGKV